MSVPKYPDLTVELENRIAQGVYALRIPTTRDLAVEFGVSRQTVTNALRPLIGKGILASGKRRGVSICSRIRERGMIGIVATGNLTALQHNDLALRKLQAQLKEDGFESILFVINNWIGYQNVRNLLSRNFVGLIFTNSSLTLEIAEYLEKRKIPFISCNRLPVYAHLNFVEHDWEEAIKKVAQSFAAQGYRRQSLFFHGRLEGYDRLVRKGWQNIKNELELPPLAGDEFDADNRDTIFDVFVKYLKTLHESGDYPDVLIIWHGIGDEILEILTSEAFRLPESCLVFGIAKTRKPLPPWIYTFDEGGNYQDVLFKAYDELRKLIAAPSKKFIHRAVEYPISWKKPTHTKEETT